MKTLRTLCAVGALLLYAGNVKAMNRNLSSAASQNINIDVTKPLSEVKKLHPFANTAEMNYYLNQTWNPNLTLKKNQEELVEKFIDNCLDTSFKLTDSSENVCLGELDSSKKFFFSKNSNPNVQGNSDGSDIVVIDGEHEFPIHLDDANLIGFFAAGSMKEYEHKLKAYLSKAAEDPVGCKLLRVFLTKTIVNKLPKMIFVPVKRENVTGKDSSIAFATFCNIAYGLGFSKEEEAGVTPLIIFAPELFTEKNPSYFIKYQNNEEKFSVSVATMPIEALLLHEMIHFYHDCSDLPDKMGIFSVIEKRMGETVSGFGYLNGRMVPKAVILYGNDEEYHTMYGITEKGWDSICESPYLAHKYGCIRYSHTSPTMTRDRKVVTSERSLIQKFVDSDRSDHDMYKFFLSSDSSIKFPKFGVGQYKCSDLDPKTGKKLSSAQ